MTLVKLSLNQDKLHPFGISDAV